jgi:hypothetical protein
MLKTLARKLSVILCSGFSRMAIRFRKLTETTCLHVDSGGIQETQTAFLATWLLSVSANGGYWTSRNHRLEADIRSPR